MIRKKAAIFFILLATSILLVQAVVPHHHHHEQVCMVTAHCQNDSNSHNHNTTDHDHEHDGNAGTECCALRQAVLIPSNSLKQETKCLGSDDAHSPLVHFQAFLFVSEYLSLVPKVISSAQIPLKNSTYSRFVSTSSGLRAPPVV